MMKPGMSTYYKFKELFDKYSKEAGKKQYLIPYFISAHPGTKDEDMVTLALWLKKNKFKLDQVQNFYPSPLANATTMYHTERNPLHKVTHTSERVSVAKKGRQRRLHKALLRYHDEKNWPIIREGLNNMGLSKLIGNGLHHLVPPDNRRGGRGAAQRGFKGAKNSQLAATRFTNKQFKQKR
jgi:radical SAM superfamily enzyme YgiQ (UPF0313 family)